MTPKEKAKELVDRFSYHCYECGGNEVQNALIAVDEILDLNLGLSNCDENNWAIDKFYNEVKQEINNL
jgi:hypothetical protein